MCSMTDNFARSVMNLSKEKLEQSLVKYQRCWEQAVRRFLENNRRVDRDAALKYQGKIDLLKELKEGQ